MRIPLLGNLELTSLRSKVAKQMFLLFILATFVPFTILACFTFIQTSKELRKQADNRLHEASKSIGMILFERLKFIESDFDIIISGLRKERSLKSLETIMDRTKRLKDSFTGITVFSSNGKLLRYGPNLALPELTGDEKQHIAKDRALLVTRPDGDSRSAIYLVKAIDPSRPSRWVVFAKISPDHLWGKQEAISLLRDLLVLDEMGNPLFMTDNSIAPLADIIRDIKTDPSKIAFIWNHNDESHLVSTWTLFIKPRYHAQWYITQIQPESEIFGPMSDFNFILILVAVLTLLMAMSLTISQIRKRLVPIETLIDATRRITDKDYTAEVMIRSNDEFEELGRSFNTMTAGIKNHFRVMDTINQIGITLSSEKDSNRIMMNILNGAKTVTYADGCALFMVHENSYVQLETMTIDSLDIVSGSSAASPIPLYDSDGAPNIRNALVYSALNIETLNIPDIRRSHQFDFNDNFQFDRERNYLTRSLLCVPMLDHEDRVIGVLQLINARPSSPEAFSHFTADDQMLIQTLASEAGVALSKNRLIQDMKKLFDALVELISTAIDEKSPYTGGHSRRVADLTIMIASAVSLQSKGPFRDVSFSEEELYELRIASLLHDCGKVTTPVHIMDKATRLQGIFDRIHLIDARFEILKRDISTSQRMQSSYSGAAPTDDFTNKQQYTVEQLQEDRDFIRSCNSAERMITEEDRRRILEIKNRYTWMTMDGDEESILSENEIENLTISEGTITPREREIINEHINLTIKMLDSLPYPASLRNIPVIVATHHERSDGSGYPRGLKGDEIPLQGRILALADVFEALLAGDRPYKRGKNLSEVLNILGSMKTKGEIDSDLFELFVECEIYSEYAAKHVPADQIDAVDTTRIPGYSPR